VIDGDTVRGERLRDEVQSVAAARVLLAAHDRRPSLPRDMHEVPDGAPIPRLRAG
jgi:hypothetical protein